MPRRSVRLSLRAVFTAACVFYAHARADTVQIPNKFAMEGPTGWKSADPNTWHELAMQLVKKAPGLPSIAKQYKGAPPLAVFAGPEVDGFMPNTNVREVKGAPTIDDKALEDYRSNAQKAFGSLKAKFDKVEFIRIGGKKAIRGEFSYTMLGKSIAAVQAVVPGRAFTLIATYTVAANDLEKMRDAIETSIQSIRVIEPWHTWLTSRPILLYGLIGAVAGGVIALLLRRRRE
jgi:hypothetical protein